MGMSHREMRVWCVAIVVVLFMGVVFRFGIGGVIGDFTGGILYTMLIAVLIYPLTSRPALSGLKKLSRSWFAAGWALLISVAIEFFQLTGIPADLAKVFPPVRLVLGTSFVALDLLAYLVGAALAGLLGAYGARILNRRSRLGTRK